MEQYGPQQGLKLTYDFVISEASGIIRNNTRPRGALPEAFESGAASALGDAGSPVEEVRGAGSVAGGRASGARLTRCWADRSQRSDQGPPPVGARRGKARHPAWAAVSPVPAKSRVRANALKALAAGDGRPPQVPKSRGQGPRAPRGRSGSAQPQAGRLPSSSSPCARPPGREHGPGLPLPLRDRGCSFDRRPGPKRPRGQRRVRLPDRASRADRVLPPSVVAESVSSFAALW